jgi:hypothetical protein
MGVLPGVLRCAPLQYILLLCVWLSGICYAHSQHQYEQISTQRYSLHALLCLTTAASNTVGGVEAHEVS